MFFEALMNRIEDTRDRDDIVHAAGRFFRLYGDIFRSIDIAADTGSAQKAA